MGASGVAHSSAYNADPFGEQQEQDTWLARRKDKQQRIQALVDEKTRQDEEKEKNSPEPTSRPKRDIYKGGDHRRWFT